MILYYPIHSTRDYFRDLVSFTNSGIASIRCHQPVPRRRVSIRPKPPRFQESKLPVHQAAIGDLVTCVALTVFELQKNWLPRSCAKFQIESCCTLYLCIKNFLKLDLRWTSAVFKRFPSHDFWSTKFSRRFPRSWLVGSDVPRRHLSRCALCTWSVFLFWFAVETTCQPHPQQIRWLMF